MYNFIQKYSLKISMLSFVMVFSLVLFMKFFDKNIFLFLLCFFFLAIGVTFYQVSRKTPSLQSVRSTRLCRRYKRYGNILNYLNNS
jgi:hypothetical protein